MILDAATERIQIALGGTVTANQLDLYSAWVDHTASPYSYTPGNTQDDSDNTNQVDVVPPPAASTQRQAKLISIYNADTVSATVTVSFYDGTNRRTLFVATLATLEQLIWEPGYGWRIYEADGTVKA